MEYLIYNARKMPLKSRRFLMDLYREAKSLRLDCAFTNRYEKCRVLVIYGLGGPDRYPLALDHMKAGGTVISFDIGYWDRDLPRRKYRISINGLHPNDFVMKGKKPSSRRFRQSKLKIETTEVNPEAPILLIGNAPKSIAVGAKNWTSEKSKELRKAFPDKTILYRPKPGRPHESKVSHDGLSEVPISEALRNTSLVVCRHSNVAVDACLLGVPVVCDDGAASAIYPSELKNYKNQPDLATRTEFLHRLAYWQWGRHEIREFWKWYLETIEV